MDTVQVGVYRHYTGRDYQVLGLARHSETEEELVVYRQLYGDYMLWVRPAAMFGELVDVDGVKQPRFSFVARQRTPRKLSVEDTQRARTFIFTQARPLERSLYAFHFENGSGEAVLSELSKFQNQDGGFGRALEPDLRTPDSSVVATTVALQTLLRLDAPEEHPLVRGAMHYLLDNYHAEQSFWPISPPTVDNAPHAPWWQPGSGSAARAEEQYINPRAEIVGYLFEYPSYTTLEFRSNLLDDVLDWVDHRPDQIEMHDLLCLLSLSRVRRLPSPSRARLMAKVKKAVAATVSLDPAGWGDYVLRPLDIARSPSSPFAPLFGDALNLDLDYRIEQQGSDGAWLPAWSWGELYVEAWPQARRDRSGVLTLGMLSTLDAFGRIDG